MKKKYFAVLDQENKIIIDTINSNLEKVNDDKQVIKINLALNQLNDEEEFLGIDKIAKLASQINIRIRELTKEEYLKYVKEAN